MTATDRRTQILEVAAQEFADGGPRGASIEVIARAAGITQPYVFRLFGSKKALFLQVVAGSFTQLADSMRTAAGDETGLDALAAMSTRYNALLADRTALQLQLQAYAACGDPEVREAVRGHLAHLWDTVAAKTLLAFGMLLNTNAALGLADVDTQWGVASAPGSGRACSATSPAGRIDEPARRHARHRPGTGTARETLPTAWVFVALLVAAVRSLGALLVTRIATQYDVSLAAADDSALNNHLLTDRGQPAPHPPRRWTRPPPGPARAADGSRRRPPAPARGRRGRRA